MTTSETEASRAWALPGTVRHDSSGAPVLNAGRCTSCSTIVFPKPNVCPSCWSESLDDHDLPRTGALYSYTVVHVARKGWQTPYVIAYVDLPNGVRVSTPLDCDPKSPPPIGSQLALTVKEIYHQADGTPVYSHHFQHRS